jgi:MFS family permease
MQVGRRSGREHDRLDVDIESLATGDPISSAGVDEAELDRRTVADGGLRYAFSSLRHRDFSLFWSAGLISNTGSWMQTITVPYVLYQLTHSTTWLGVSAFAAFFPSLVVGPIAGPMADRMSRQRILMVTQTLQMLVAFSLWACWVAGVATPWVILAHLLLSGIAGGINISSWQSFVPLLVPPGDMLNAVRLNTMQFTGARAFGPAIGGLVLARFGPATAFMFNAVTYLLVIAALAAVSPRATPPPMGDARFLHQFKEGLAYVRARTGLWLTVVTITSISLLSSAVIQLAPALAKDEFDVGKAAYGLLVAMFGAGAIIGVVIMGAYGERIRRSTTTMIGLAVSSASVVVLGATPFFSLGLAVLLTMGVAYAFLSVSLNTTIQARVVDAYRGRALSIYLMGLMVGVPIGALIEGWLANVIGLRSTVVGVGVVQGAFAVCVITLSRGMTSLDENVDAEEPAVTGGAVS